MKRTRKEKKRKKKKKKKNGLKNNYNLLFERGIFVLLEGDFSSLYQWKRFPEGAIGDTPKNAPRTGNNCSTGQ